METQDILRNIDLSNSENIKFVFNLKASFNKALGDFHKKVSPPSKNGHVSFNNRKYDYVLFEDLSKAIDKALNDIDLTWNQDTFSDEEKGVAGARTIIRCESNGYEEATKWVRIKVNGKSQDIGSALTYAKRYSLSSAFGINSETDDDGQRAQTSVKGNKTKQSPKAQKLITEKQEEILRGKFIALSQLRGTKATDEALNYLKMVNLKHIKDLDVAQANDLFKQLDSDIKKINKTEPKKQDDIDAWLDRKGVEIAND